MQNSSKMSSRGATKSIYATSDQLFDHTCGSCITDDRETEASKYCEDCAEYLCDSCADFHRKLPLLKNHSVVPTSNISDEKPDHRLKNYCACNTNQEVAVYCEDHTEFICSSCQSIKHHKCTTMSIQQKSSGYTSSSLNLILTKTQSLKDAYEQLKKECQENESELERSKDACKEEIQAFRKEIGEIVNTLEENMLTELDQCVTKHRQRLDQHIKTLTAAIQMLDQEHTSLEKARKDGNKESMFIAETRVSANLRNYQARLDELEKNHFSTQLTFKRNAPLDDLQKCVDALGTIKVLKKKVQISQKMLFLGHQIQQIRKANVRLAQDKCDPEITGCVFMPNGHFVACDDINCTIKLFDSSLSYKDCLEMESNPRDVSVVDENTVIVTIPPKEQLQYIHIKPKLKHGKIIQLDKWCWGVDVYLQDIYVSFHNPGEVRVLDKQGNLKRRLGVGKEGSRSFSDPDHVTVSNAGDKIYVSDKGNKSVTCMETDGSIIYQYKDSSLKKPGGLIFDDGGNVIVCDRYSSNICVIGSDGKKHSILSLSGQKESIQPMSVAYRRSDNTLVVGCDGCDHLLVCQLMN